MPQIKAVVFDLYGTLYDVHSVVRQCEAVYPRRGTEISLLWRQKQLEYSWLRSLMGHYIPFEEATRDALVFTCNQLKLDLSQETCAALCDAYLNLAPYPEVPDTLRRLRERGLPLAILSNGSVFSIGSVVQASGLQDYFAHLISVEAVRVFKPDFRVYRLACETLGLRAEDILFVSSNAWDAAGASHFGFNVCWVKRGDKTFDELGAQPKAIVGDVAGVETLLGSTSPPSGK
jgi:2-haloacid dehalogenase